MCQIQKWSLVLIIIHLRQYSQSEVRFCSVSDGKKESNGTGKFILIGMFPTKAFRSGKFNRLALVRAEAMKFSIGEANKMLSASNITAKLEYSLYNTCNRGQYVINSLLDMFLDKRSRLYHGISQQPSTKRVCHSQHNHVVLGVVGPASSGPAKMMSSLTDTFKIPVVSYGATSPDLSDKRLHPNFMRTIPSDKFQAKLIVDLLLIHNWTYVSLITEESSYGRGGRDELFGLFKLHNICTSVKMSYSRNHNKKIKMILRELHRDRLANVVILWGDVYALEFLRLSHKERLRNLTWIVTEAIGIRKRLLYVDLPVIQGLITITPFAGFYPEFEKYFWSISSLVKSNTWLQAFLRRKGKAGFPNSTVTLQYFKSLFSLDKAGFVRNAVFAYAHALKKYLQECKGCNINSSKNIQSFNMNTFVNKYLKNVTFSGLSGELLSFDGNGDVQNSLYHIYIVQLDVMGKYYFKEIGEWSYKTKFKNTSNFANFCNQKRHVKSECSRVCSPGYYAIIQGDKACCWECVRCKLNHFKNTTGNQACQKCPEYHVANFGGTECLQLHRDDLKYSDLQGIAIIIQSIIGSILTLFHLIVFVRYRKTPIVRASNATYSFIQLVAQILAFVALLLYLIPDGQFICTARLMITGALLTTVFSILLAKSVLLLRIFQQSLPCSKKQRLLNRSTPVFTVLFFVTLHLVIETTTCTIHPPTLTYTENLSQLKYSISCNIQWSFQLQNIYFVLLLLACSIQGFRARKLPRNFNEARFISYATFVSGLLLLMIQPLYQSLQSPKAKYLMVSTFLFATNLCLLLVVYSYKVWIMLMKPNLNSIEVFRASLMSHIKEKYVIQLRPRKKTIYTSLTNVTNITE